MPRLQLSLLVKVVLTLAATGLLPLTISFYQLRVNKNALLTQLQSTHMVAARTTAARVEAFLEPLTGLAGTVAQTAIHQSARSSAMQELLYGTLQTQPAVAAVAIFKADGEEIIRAQRPGIQEEIALAYEAGAPALSFFQGSTRRWLRLVEELEDDLGQVVLAAEVGGLEEIVVPSKPLEIGDEAFLVLASFAGDVLFGLDHDLSAFPSEAVDAALAGKLRSGANKYQGPQTAEDLVVAYADVTGAPWVVLSRQPTRLAEVAQQRIRRAAWGAAFFALALTTAISSLAFTTVIQPLRRLVKAQQKLMGADFNAQGSEIAQLEEAFALLEQRVRDSDDLGKIVLGRYEVKKVLGSGAMGTVFKGWDPQLERELAIKTIRLETEEAKRQKLVDTLLREAKTSARFNHPNIVTTYDAANEGGAAFIAMEFVDGITVEDLISLRERLEWRQVVPLGAAVARGLATAHSRQLVHQDVKPANILLGHDGSIKVTDFGISQLISSASASDGVVCGTPGYIAPECLEGAGYSPKSDLFALGVLLHECLTGEHPFAAKNLRLTIVNTLNKAPEALAPHQPDMPPELGELVFQLLEKQPDRRPATAEEVARTLEKIALDLELKWDLPTLKPQSTRPSSSRPSQRQQLISLAETQQVATRHPDA